MASKALPNLPHTIFSASSFCSSCPTPADKQHTNFAKLHSVLQMECALSLDTSVPLYIVSPGFRMFFTLSGLTGKLLFVHLNYFQLTLFHWNHPGVGCCFLYVPTVPCSDNTSPLKSIGPVIFLCSPNTKHKDMVQEAVIKTIPKKNKCKRVKWLSEEVLQIAEKRREVKGKGKVISTWRQTSRE